ncbi:unnamed protein product [Effrenium voratum]|nr:unnamed protein product [Effrenium voratum]
MMLTTIGAPLAPVPEKNAGSAGLHVASTVSGERRPRPQLPPVLEGDVPVCKSPEASSPSAASISAEPLRVEAWPSDSEASASESAVSIAESNALSVSARSLRRMTEPNVPYNDGRKKSPRSSLLNKLNSVSKRSAVESKSSLGATRTESIPDERNLHSSTTQTERNMRRAASAPPQSLRDMSAESTFSGLPGSRKQLSTGEHATPPREQRRSVTGFNERSSMSGKLKVNLPSRPASASRESSMAASASVPRLPSQRNSKLETFRAQRSAAPHLRMALSEDVKDAFRRALLQGTYQPRCAKLGFVGPARAGKTSTLRALSGLPLRAEEETTPGLACWALSQELLSAAPGHRWQLQEQGAASTARWDRGVAKYVADMVRQTASGPASGVKPASCSDTLDPGVMKRMPVDLIARRLGETKNGSPSQDEKTVVLEAYDFGGQEVYYAMHHLFLSDYGIYLACVDLSALRLSMEAEWTESSNDELEEGDKSTQTWDALEWWLASIVVHAPNSPVAIVGTHDDCLAPSSRLSVHTEVHERIEAFCKKLPELNERLHINEPGQLCFFPIDNSGTDGGSSVGRLQAAVEDMVSKLMQGALGKPIPLRWSHFWAWMQRTSSNSIQGPLIEVEDLWKRSQKYGFESQAELQGFLKHFHGLGMLLHFPEVEELRYLVCLKPAWVGEAAAAVLTAKDKVFQGCVRQCAELREKGLLHTQLLSAVWRTRPFAKYNQQLVGLLQALDLLLAWGHDKQTQQQTPRGPGRHADVQKLFLVPSQLPRRQREEVEAASQDAVVLYLDFHGLLRRLLPTLIPRLLCSLSRVESGVQILSIYANYARFAISTQGQARGDSLRSSGGRRTMSMLLVSVQPCGEFLRCCLRPRRGAEARLSFKHVVWLLHSFRDAVAAWMPRISFRAGIRCPTCTAGHAHVLDLHSLLREEDLVVCTRSGDLVEDLPSWLLDWRQHHQHRQQPSSPRAREEEPDSKKQSTSSARPPGEALQLEYLYASPLDLAPLDIRTEIEALAAIPGLQLTVRTATTETLAEVWRTERGSSVRVLVLAAHCAVSALAQPSLMLEDNVGHAHVLGSRDLDDLIALNGPEVAAGGKPSAFDVVLVDACHSEALARRFVEDGAGCAVGCAGEIFDAAAREFLRIFLRSLAAAAVPVAAGSTGATSAAAAAFLAAQRAVRLSPQPGLRSEAERFCFVPELPACGEPRLPAALKSSGEQLFSHLPPAVEDFVGRGSTMSAVATAFLRQRRVVWLHGKAGIGKSALVSEFCRFYAMPGDRLFSPRRVFVPDEAEAAAGAATRGGARLLRLSGLGPAVALQRLRDALRGSVLLLALDGVDESFALEDGQAEELWKCLGEALAETSLKVLLASRFPRYDAPIPGKVVAIEVQPLCREDACLLLARRAHRPLFQRDLDSSSRPNGEPLALTPRRQLLKRMAQHPLAAAVGGAPADIIAAASKVTPQLTSLFAHPLLQDEPPAPCEE